MAQQPHGMDDQHIERDRNESKQVRVRIGDPTEPEPTIDVTDVGPRSPESHAERDPVDAEELEELRRERDEFYDRMLRGAAEFDNYRKRVERERREQAGAAAVDLLAELLPLVDNLERALEIQAPPEAEPYRQGVELIHRQLLDLLKKRGVTPIEAVGTPFDPRVHEAVIHEVSPGHADGEVIGELRRGYRLGDRLLRPAMVRVAKA